jgi:hypothetical protein
MLDPITALQIVATVGGGAACFIEQAYKFFQAVKSIKDAPKHARQLVSELSAVASLIPQLQDVLTDSLNADLDTFNSMVIQMRSKMQVVGKYKTEQLKWPFTEAETEAKLREIGRYKETFGLALASAMAYRSHN